MMQQQQTTTTTMQGNRHRSRYRKFSSTRRVNRASKRRLKCHRRTLPKYPYAAPLGIASLIPRTSLVQVSESDNETSSGGNKEKLGHRRVDETGTVTYKRVMVDDLMKSLQIGLNYVLGKHHQPQRQVLLQDFQQIEYQDFPP